jgi:3-oxoacyl-[acyl-carrier protein] reductase
MNQQTIIITGASRGIGKAIALELASKDVNLVLTARNIHDLEEVAFACKQKEAEALIIPGDLADPDFPLKIIEKSRDHFHHLDVLINNAAVGYPKSFEETTLEEWNFFMNINAKAPFLLCKHALPYLKKSDHPFIINISSVVGHKGYPNQLAYTASKHALLGLTKVLAREMHDTPIKVHAICPGGVDTDMVASTRPDLDPSVLMKPEEIANIIVFLLKQKGNAVIDQINVRRSKSTPFD